MKFVIRMGVPDMEAFWKQLTEREGTNSLSADEKKFFKKFVKVLDHLRSNPKHNSLNTHEIDALSKSMASVFSNRILRIRRLQQAAYSGLMVPTKARSPF
jgi:hypothetical protein